MTRRQAFRASDCPLANLSAVQDVLRIPPSCLGGAVMKRKWSASQEQVANEWEQGTREGEEFYILTPKSDPQMRARSLWIAGHRNCSPPLA